MAIMKNLLESDPWQLQIIQLLHLQLNITRAKRFGSTVFTLMYIFILKKRADKTWLFYDITCIYGSDLWQRNLQNNKCTNCLILCYKCSNGIVRNILFEDFVAKVDFRM